MMDAMIYVQECKEIKAKKKTVEDAVER